METEPGAVRQRRVVRGRKQKETDGGIIPLQNASHSSIPERVFPVPPPLDQFITPRNPTEDSWATTILQLAEAVAQRRLEPIEQYAPVNVAASAPYDLPLPPVQEPLLHCLEGLFNFVDADPSLQATMDALPEMLGDGYPLLLLFRGLFQPKPQPVLRPDGKPYLTAQQARILDSACEAPIRSDIADALGITLNTVDTHFRQIYQRLGVRSQEEAVARAYALGYLKTFDLHNLIFRMGHHVNFQVFQNLCSAPRNITPAPSERFRAMAQVGVLLLLAAGMVAREASSRQGRPGGFQDGGIVETDRQGRPVKRWDADDLGVIRALVTIPPRAQRQGFTPGNVLALHDIAQQNLNRGAITEFTPKGKRVRTFTGGNDVATRLIGPLSAAFGGDGRLLVTSGWLTNGILAFSDNGRQVCRFAEGPYSSIAVLPNQDVIACLFNGKDAALLVFDPHGVVRCTLKPLATRKNGELPLGYPTHSGFTWWNVSVDSQGRILILRDDHAVDSDEGLLRIEVLDAHGEFLEMFRVPPGSNCLISTSENGLLAVPSTKNASVSILRSDGKVLHTIERPMSILPYCCAFLPDSLLIAGERDVPRSE